MLKADVAEAGVKCCQACLSLMYQKQFEVLLGLLKADVTEPGVKCC